MVCCLPVDDDLAFFPQANVLPASTSFSIPPRRLFDENCEVGPVELVKIDISVPSRRRPLSAAAIKSRRLKFRGSTLTLGCETIAVAGP
jgi:hypothetical protein